MPNRYYLMAATSYVFAATLPGPGWPMALRLRSRVIRFYVGPPLFPGRV